MSVKPDLTLLIYIIPLKIVIKRQSTMAIYILFGID